MKLEKDDIVVIKNLPKWENLIGYIDEVKNNDLYLIAIPIYNHETTYLRLTSQNIEKVGSFPDEHFEEKDDIYHNV